METEATALRLIGGDTDTGLCVDGVCAVPGATQQDLAPAQPDVEPEAAQ
jgi:hypothetical protein